MEERFKPILELHQKALESDNLIIEAKKAAVSVIITNDEIESTPKLVLIKRSTYNGHHSGQMAFPGGKMDTIDQNLLETVIRESKEEIGIDLSTFELKPLLPVWVKVSNFIIQPYLTHVNKKLSFDINKREINRIFEIPLDIFQSPHSIKAHQIDVFGKTYWSPYFEYNGETIWGATALILYQNIFLKDPISNKL